MATLTGKLTDVISRPPDSISSITVKAPSARIGSGTDVIVSSPAEVTFDKTTGDITISGLTGGLSWLYIEGDGWSDSIPLAVAEGMITLVEAVANAAGAPGIADYTRLLANLELAVDNIALDAVDQASEDIQWYKGFINDSHQSMSDVPVGLWGIAARPHAERFGLPSDFGSLQVMPIGASKSAFFLGQTTGFWTATEQGGVWGEWKKTPDFDDLTNAAQVGGAGLKTAAVALTAGSLLNGTPGRVRLLTQVTAPVTRWRVHIESRRMVNEASSEFVLGNVYVGHHTGGGNATGLTTLKTGNITVPGSVEWKSKWITNDLSQETVVDFEVSGTGLFSSQAPGYRFSNGSWVPTKNSAASVWIEVETPAQTPVVALIGDSTGAGQGADLPVHESALHIAARKHRFIPMLYAYPGSSMQSINNREHHLFQRWSGLAAPDSVIIQSGSNDIHAGTSVADLRTRFTELAELARTISPVVIGSTVKARYPDSGAHQTNLNSHNTWVKTQPAGIRDFLDFYAKLSPNGTVAAADAADAAHLTTRGHGKLALAFDDVTVAREELSEVLAAKADTTYVDSELSEKADTTYVDDEVSAKADKTYVDNEVDAAKWKRPQLTPDDYPSLDEIPDGVHPILFWSYAYDWGLPHAGPGSLTQLSYGSRRIQRWINREGEIVYRESMRILSDGVWSPWTTEEFGIAESHWVGRTGDAGKRVRLNEDGKLAISTASITGNADPVNLAFLRNAIITAQDEIRWDQGRFDDSQNIDDAPDGWVSVWGGVGADTVGLPIDKSSLVLTKRFGRSGFQMQVAVGDASVPMMIRRRSVDVWDEWQELGGTDTAPTPTLSPSGLKRVPLAVTLGNPNGDTRPETGSYRVPVQWNAPIVRWRLHVSTRNPRTGAVAGRDVTLTRATWGQHAGSGDFTATPTTIAEGVTVPGTGESVALPWQTTPIPEGVEHLLGFDYTSTGEVLALAGGSWSTTGDASTATATTARDWLTPLDWWVEAETYATTPVIAFVGDSTSVGVGTSFQVKDGWPSRYCRDFGALPVHYAGSGASTFDFRYESDPLLQRWQDLARPDAIVWALGANDFGAGTWTVEQVKARAIQSIDRAASLAPAVYVATAKPRNTDSEEQEANMAEFNAWLRSLPQGVRDCFDVAAQVDDGTGNIRPEYNADDVHVNNLGVTAMLGAVRQMTAPPVAYVTAP